MRFKLYVNADKIEDVQLALERALWDISKGRKGKRPRAPQRVTETLAALRAVHGTVSIDYFRCSTAYGGPVDDRDPERARMSWQIMYPDEKRWVDRGGDWN